MEKQCGYVDTNGLFHNTEKECELSNIVIKIEDAEEVISNIEERIKTSLYNSVCLYSYIDIVIDKSAEWIFGNSDCLLKLLLEKKELESQLSALKKEQEELSKPESSWIFKALNSFKPNKS